VWLKLPGGSWQLRVLPWLCCCALWSLHNSRRHHPTSCTFSSMTSGMCTHLNIELEVSTASGPCSVFELCTAFGCASDVLLQVPQAARHLLSCTPCQACVALLVRGSPQRYMCSGAEGNYGAMCTTLFPLALHVRETTSVARSTPAPHTHGTNTDIFHRPLLIITLVQCPARRHTGMRTWDFTTTSPSHHTLTNSHPRASSSHSSVSVHACAHPLTTPPPPPCTRPPRPPPPPAANTTRTTLITVYTRYLRWPIML
jgi:hypothetical protein